MTRHLNKGLPFRDWPEMDLSLWNRAFELGPFGHTERPLSATTIYNYQSAYRLWLGFIGLAAPELLTSQPASRITKKNVEDYVEYLRTNLRETTIFISLQRLHLAIRAMCPDDDWKWLYGMSRRLARDAVPIHHPLVLTPDLYRVALQLIDLAEQRISRHGRIGKSAATLFRDGVLIATLVEAPMRRRAMANLQLDKHVEQVGSRFYLIVPEELSKTRRAQSYSLSDELSQTMSYYVEKVRPEFPGANEHAYLWPQIGRPMTDKMIRRRTIKWTGMILGVEVPPHRFRNAAASFIAAEDPENIRVARDLLGHATFAMTEKHYVDAAQSRIAGRELARVLQNWRTKEGES